MNNKKGFANIVLIVLVVILAGAAGYFALVKKPLPPITPSEPNNTEPSTPTLAPTFVPLPTSATNIKVLYPNGGEYFNFYQPITIKWENNQRQKDIGSTEIYLCKVDPALITPLSEFIKDNTICFGEITTYLQDLTDINTISWDVGTVDDGLIVPPGYKNYGIKPLPPSAGNYRIKVVHYFGPDKSIIEDLSDASFSIGGNITPSVDLKINNSDDQIQVKTEEKVKFDWVSKGATKCLAHGEGWSDRDSSGNYVFNDPQKSTAGSQIVKMPKTTYSFTTSYELFCSDDNNHRTMDYVFVTINP